MSVLADPYLPLEAPPEQDEELLSLEPPPPPKRKPPVERMPHEILVEIGSFLSLQELLFFEVIGKMWKEVGEMHNELWLDLLEKAWKATGWTFNVPPIVLLKERIKSTFNVAGMRKALILYDTRAVSEKEELVNLLANRLLYGKLCGSGTRQQHGFSFPGWTKRVNPGKLSLLWGLREIHRQVPLNSELIAYTWNLTYKHIPAESYPVKFYENHDMTCSSHGETRFSWRVVQGTHGGTLQVETFPPHRLYRTSEGLWQWENDHVVCVQGGQEVEPMKIPLL